MQQNPLAMWLARREVKAVRFAERLGMSAPSLSHILTGRRKASPLVQAQIAQLTDCSVTPNDWNAYYVARATARGRRGSARKKTAA
jgi:DNA-binding transcriptional regulator YdaS (Cro superfamily)